MDKEKLKFYSIGRGSLNLNGKFYYGLDYAITDFMMDLEQQVKKQKEVIDKAEKILNECKLLMPHEFDWEEQVDNALDILKEVSK